MALHILTKQLIKILIQLNIKTNQTIIKHSDKFINYNDSFPAMMDTAEELLDEVRNKILGERQIELDENELAEIIFDRIYKFRGHRTPFSLTAAINFDDNGYDPDSDFEDDSDSDTDSDDSDDDSDSE